MSFKHVIPLAIVAMVGASTTAFAARTSTDSGSDQTVQHRRHAVLQRRDQAPAYAAQQGDPGGPPWILPQGWPHT